VPEKIVVMNYCAITLCKLLVHIIRYWCDLLTISVLPAVIKLLTLVTDQKIFVTLIKFSISKHSRNSHN